MSRPMPIKALSARRGPSTRSEMRVTEDEAIAEAYDCDWGKTAYATRVVQTA